MSHLTCALELKVVVFLNLQEKVSGPSFLLDIRQILPLVSRRSDALRIIMTNHLEKLSLTYP